MLLYELICESRSADLYHGTTLDNLNRLLQDNVLIARTPIHSTKIPQNFNQHTKTVSLTRNPSVATNFARASSVNGDITGTPVVLVLDQNKLHQTLGKRIRPYDDLDSLDKTYGDQNKAGSRAAGNNESEEVVFGNINNINSFIKNIIIHSPVKPSKEELVAFNKYKKILSDPRVVVADYLNKNLTGRQFMQLTAPKQNVPAV